MREAAAKTGAEAARVAADFGDEVVVKLLSKAVAHKTEIGGVRVGVAIDRVERTCAEIAAAARDAGVEPTEGFLIQEQIAGGVEVILGFARDPQLGPAILVGAGGIAAELYNDTAIRLLPVTRGDVDTMLDELALGAVLGGFRGRPESDVGALTDAVLNFAGLCESLGKRLADAEINPLFVMPAGKGVKAADGLVVLAGHDA